MSCIARQGLVVIRSMKLRHEDRRSLASNAIEVPSDSSFNNISDHSQQALQPRQRGVSLAETFTSSCDGPSATVPESGVTGIQNSHLRRHLDDTAIMDIQNPDTQSDVDEIPCKCPECVQFFTTGQLYSSRYLDTSAGHDMVNAYYSNTWDDPSLDSNETKVRESGKRKTDSNDVGNAGVKKQKAEMAPKTEVQSNLATTTRRIAPALLRLAEPSPSAAAGRQHPSLIPPPFPKFLTSATEYDKQNSANANTTLPRSADMLADTPISSRSPAPALLPSNASTPTSASTPHTKRKYVKTERQTVKEAARLAAMDEETREREIKAANRAKARRAARKAAEQEAAVRAQAQAALAAEAEPSSGAAAGSMIEQGEEQSSEESA